MPADRAPTYPFTNAPVFDSRELRHHPKAGTKPEFAPSLLVTKLKAGIPTQDCPVSVQFARPR